MSSFTTTVSSPSPTISSATPTVSAASSSPPLTTHLIVGLGAGLGIPLALMLIGYLMLLAWWRGRHSRNLSTRADTNFQSRIRASFHSLFSDQQDATERQSRALSTGQSIAELTAGRSIAELAVEREAAELEARTAKEPMPGDGSGREDWT